MIRGVDPGPLANYNSLTDKHLSGYFANLRMRKHLMKSGLVSRDGVVTSESEYRLKMAKLEHRKHVRDFLASAIVEKALDMERLRQHEIRKRLDDLYKLELVNKIKSDRALRPTGEDELVELFSPLSKISSTRLVKSANFKEKTKLPTINFDGRNQSSYEGNNTGKSNSQQHFLKPHPPLGKIKKKKKTNRGLKIAKSDLLIGHRVQLQSMAEVTMKYLGSLLNLTNDLFSSNRLSEVQVIQQHCGGNTVCVFRELLPSNTVFTFVSRRHRGSPFGLTININGIRNIRLSSCCEYKHRPGYKIGGKNSQFMLVSVQGASPCYRCQVQLKMNSGNNPNNNENDSSSDEEEAVNSFDVIVSRAGHRNKEKERPISASVHTATQTLEDSEEKYIEDQFEENEGQRLPDLNDNRLISDDSSASESDDNKTNIKKQHKVKKSKSSSSSEEEEEKEEKEVEKEEYKKDFSFKNNEQHEQVDLANAQKEQKTALNSSDDESEVSSNESIEVHENTRVDNKNDSEVEDSDTESVSSNEGEFKKLSDTVANTKSNNIGKLEKVHVEKYNELEDKEDSDADGYFDSKEDDEISTEESDKPLNHKLNECDKENQEEETKNSNDDSECSKNEQSIQDKKVSLDYESSFEKDTDKDDNDDDDDDNDGSEKRSGYMSSVISRESTTLTGNEDGHFDSANKTIQFNEEVDVVHYSKNDDVSPELTPRSDEDNSESEYNIVKNTDGKVILTDLGQSSDEDVSKLSDEDVAA
ncbi:glutamate rich 3 [Hydra vulgaris]|uniref:glutamate rich 3 n=1 Tax=Hydra vulgaris TaxID=6087 RepID=UPI00064113EB|nr:glutamate-rich protein 3 [Hydra vulgaris]